MRPTRHRLEVTTLALALFLAQAPELGPSVTAAVLDTDDYVIVAVRDGEKFEGRQLSRNKETRTFTTALGERRIDSTLIVGETAAAARHEEYRSKLNAIDPLTRDARIELARWCLDVGLTRGLHEQLHALLDDQPLDDFAWHTLTNLAAKYDVTARNPASPEDVDRWQRKQVDLLYRALAKADRVRVVLVAAQLQALPIDIQVNQAIRFAERGDADERFVGLRLLAEARESRRVKTLYRAALSDASWRAREVAVDSLKRRDDGTTFRPFVKALLGHKDAFVRSNAATALGQLGDRRGVAPLVRALRATGDGRVARNNISTMNQIAYVKDYDVEVAQTAFIADPVVDIVIDGLVLDVGIVDIKRERSIIGRSLNRLTNAGLPADIKTWTDWWNSPSASELHPRN